MEGEMEGGMGEGGKGRRQLGREVLMAGRALYPCHCPCFAESQAHPASHH